MQGCERGEVKSKPETGLQSLGQGSWIRARNREGWAGSSTWSSENGTKVCGWMGYAVEDLRMSLGRGNTWIRVLVQCYTECNMTHVVKVVYSKFKLPFASLSVRDNVSDSLSCSQANIDSTRTPNQTFQHSICCQTYYFTCPP